MAKSKQDVLDESIVKAIELLKAEEGPQPKPELVDLGDGTTIEDWTNVLVWAFKVCAKLRRVLASDPLAIAYFAQQTQMIQHGVSLSGEWHHVLNVRHKDFAELTLLPAVTAELHKMGLNKKWWPVDSLAKALRSKKTLADCRAQAAQWEAVLQAGSGWEEWLKKAVGEPDSDALADKIETGTVETERVVWHGHFAGMTGTSLPTGTTTYLPDGDGVQAREAISALFGSNPGVTALKGLPDYKTGLMAACSKGLDPTDVDGLAKKYMQPDEALANKLRPLLAPIGVSTKDNNLLFSMQTDAKLFAEELYGKNLPLLAFMTDVAARQPDLQGFIIEVGPPDIQDPPAGTMVSDYLGLTMAAKYGAWAYAFGYGLARWYAWLAGGTVAFIEGTADPDAATKKESKRCRFEHGIVSVVLRFASEMNSNAGKGNRYLTTFDADGAASTKAYRDALVVLQTQASAGWTQGLADGAAPVTAKGALHFAVVPMARNLGGEPLTVEQAKLLLPKAEDYPGQMTNIGFVGVDLYAGARPAGASLQSLRNIALAAVQTQGKPAQLLIAEAGLPHARWEQWGYYNSVFKKAPVPSTDPTNESDANDYYDKAAAVWRLRNLADFAPALNVLRLCDGVAATMASLLPAYKKLDPAAVVPRSVICWFGPNKQYVEGIGATSPYTVNYSWIPSEKDTSPFKYWNGLADLASVEAVDGGKLLEADKQWNSWLPWLDSFVNKEDGTVHATFSKWWMEFGQFHPGVLSLADITAIAARYPKGSALPEDKFSAEFAEEHIASDLDKLVVAIKAGNQPAAFNSVRTTLANWLYYRGGPAVAVLSKLSSEAGDYLEPSQFAQASIDPRSYDVGLPWLKEADILDAFASSAAGLTMEALMAAGSLDAVLAAPEEWPKSVEAHYVGKVVAS